MSNPYLIAHKVRGEPAFDIATQMRCPNCQGVGGPNVLDFETGKDPGYEGYDCIECDGQGYWWIIPTSGHRAYPYWHKELECITEIVDLEDGKFAFKEEYVEMPPDLPDHYTAPAEPKLSPKTTQSGKALLATLGLATQSHAAMQGTLKRRI